MGYDVTEENGEDLLTSRKKTEDGAEGRKGMTSGRGDFFKWRMMSLGNHYVAKENGKWRKKKRQKGKHRQIDGWIKVDRSIAWRENYD